MPARSLAALGATLILVACSTDAPTTASPLLEATGSPLTERTPAPPTSGVLKVCLASGAGLTAGQSFTSAITLAGVVRSLANTTGNCAQLEVPRESTPQGKGLLQSKPTEVARLLPGSAKLVVAGADLAPADVLAILGAAPNVQASSALLLNLTQQLIATDLNVLRGVQASSQVNQAIADANAALAITLGSPITIGGSLASSQASALVTALAAFNDGKTKPPAPPASVDVDIVQTAVKNVEIQSIGCVPSTELFGRERRPRSGNDDRHERQRNAGDVYEPIAADPARVHRVGDRRPERDGVALRGPANGAPAAGFRRAGRRLS